MADLVGLDVKGLATLWLAGRRFLPRRKERKKGDKGTGRLLCSVICGAAGVPPFLGRTAQQPEAPRYQQGRDAGAGPRNPPPNQQRPPAAGGLAP